MSAGKGDNRKVGIHNYSDLSVGELRGGGKRKPDSLIPSDYPHLRTFLSVEPALCLFIGGDLNHHSAFAEDLEGNAPPYIAKSIFGTCIQVSASIEDPAA